MIDTTTSCRTRLSLFFPLVILTSVLLPVLASTAGANGFELSNGSKPITGNGFTLAYYSSTPVDHDTERQLGKLSRELDDVLKRASRLGIDLREVVHVRLWSDLEFPARDIWSSHGIEPDDRFFEMLKERIELTYAVTTIEELIGENSKNLRDFPFLSRLPIPYEISQQGIDDLRGETMDRQMKDADKYLQALKDSLDAPLSDVTRFYYVAKSSCYEPQNNMIWVPWRGGKHNLHRDWDVITHEVGHFVFLQLAKQVIRDNDRKEGASPLSLALLIEPLLALNEFFADFTAVSNGNLINIDLHHYDGLPDESKRYFSKKRNLSSYIEAASRPGDDGYYLKEAHNSLNPSRYFVWKLMLELNSDTVEKLVFSAMRDWVTDYFTKDIDRYRHRPLRVEPGCFAILGYPTDIKSVNLRLFSYLAKEADRFLDDEGLRSFHKLAVEVYGADNVSADARSTMSD